MCALVSCACFNITFLLAPVSVKPSREEKEAQDSNSNSNSNSNSGYVRHLEAERDRLKKQLHDETKRRAGLHVALQSHKRVMASLHTAPSPSSSSTVRCVHAALLRSDQKRAARSPIASRPLSASVRPKSAATVSTFRQALFSGFLLAQLMFAQFASGAVRFALESKRRSACLAVGGIRRAGSAQRALARLQRFCLADNAGVRVHRVCGRR